MELVQGIPITEYCDQQRLTPRERLELFLPVCQAIQHAHQKGIIHRDIKPSNIMVAIYDGQPVPKVIDFGVAKATGQRLTEKTLFTHYGQLVGTLEYMSPEQARLDHLDVDTRSDIYSLGVVLYELLTGGTPIDPERLRSAAFDEMMQIIREEEPPPPSTRLSTSDTLPSVAANRHVEPQRLKTLVHGELDWIVMKALDKQRSRRYATASGFADDIGRYLNDETVSACPPSAGYRFGKFARRYKRPMILTGAVAAALVLGLVGTAWQAVRATHAEQMARAEADRANREAETAQAARAAEAEQLKTARQKAAEADSVVKFLVDDLLGSAAPEKALGRKITVEEVLAEAEKKIDTAFTDQPVVEAAIRHTLGTTYQKLGKNELAERHFKRASELRTTQLGPEHPHTLRVARSLVRVCESIVWSLTASPSDHSPVDLARALELARKATEEAPKKTSAWNLLGMAHYRSGQWQAAVDALNTGMEIGDDGSYGCFFCLAMAHRQLGHTDEARAWYDKGVEWMKKEKPDDKRMHSLRSEAAELLGIELSDENREAREEESTNEEERSTDSEN